MRTGNLLFSAVHLFVVLFIVGVGVFFLLLPNSIAFRLTLEQLLVSDTSLFAKIGIGITCFGVLLLVGFYILNKKNYLTFKINGSRILIDEAIIQDYLKQYWREVFPHHDIYSEVVFHFPQKLEIVAQLPKMNEEEKTHLLLRMQNELSVLLARKLGYEKEFFLTINVG